MLTQRLQILMVKELQWLCQPWLEDEILRRTQASAKSAQEVLEQEARQADHGGDSVSRAHEPL